MYSKCFSDYRLVTGHLHVQRYAPSISRYQCRDLRRVDLSVFHDDIRRSPLYVFDASTSVDDYVELYNSRCNACSISTLL